MLPEIPRFVAPNARLRLHGSSLSRKQSVLDVGKLRQAITRRAATSRSAFISALSALTSRVRGIGHPGKDALKNKNIADALFVFADERVQLPPRSQVNLVLSCAAWK